MTVCFRFGDCGVHLIQNSFSFLGSGALWSKVNVSKEKTKRERRFSDQGTPLLKHLY